MINMRGETVKPWLIRFPEELFDWIRVRAAERTIQEKHNV